MLTFVIWNEGYFRGAKLVLFIVYKLQLTKVCLVAIAFSLFSCLGIVFILLVKAVYLHIGMRFFFLGCKLLEHQEPAGPYVPDCSWHDQREDTRGNSQDL